MRTAVFPSRFFLMLVFSAVLTACGGDDDAKPPPAVSTGIGATGGTVAGPSGAQAIIPAGALSTTTPIAVTQSNAGAPPLPAGLTAAGSMFAFTPHGTTFASPVTITVPFDPASVPANSVPRLYKTNGTLTEWAEVANAAIDVSAGSSTMSGQVTGFSLAVVLGVPIREHPEFTEKSWKFRLFEADSVGGKAPFESNAQVGGEVHRQLPVGGPLVFPPANQPFPEAAVEVFSSESGKTFYTVAQAPTVVDGAPDNTTTSDLVQTFTFKRPRGAVPSLKFVLSRVFLETIDGGGAAPSLESCPWLGPELSDDEIEEACFQYMMRTQVQFRLRATRNLAPDFFFSTAGIASLNGAGSHWRFHVGGVPDFPGALWTSSNFTFTGNASGSDGRHAFVNLAAPLVVTVPVEGNVGDEETFTVEIELYSLAENRVQGESYAAAFIRDPLDSTGLTLEFSGLEQVPVQHPLLAPVAKPCTTGADPAAGTVRFAGAQFAAPERLDDAEVFIERVAGSKGEVSVMLDTVDDTALAGSDYQEVHTLVRFGDGQSGDLAVAIPLLLDDEAEPNKSVKLKLTPFIGCAAVDAATATLVIEDDDRPLPVTPTFTVGGTVSGLAGSGLRLTTAIGASVQPVANGGFTFALPLNDHAQYSVSVAQQPVNPAQICTVANGAGTIAGANVSDILVSCAAAQPNGALDVGFGSQGKVNDTSRAVTAIALQPDGKLLAIGGMTLSRFNANGSLDAGFGSAGRVTLVADGSANDAAHALALQADGRIVVAGTTTLPTVLNERCFVQRFNADGTLDGNFGTDGKLLTAFTDDAKSLLIQPDGKILVAGTATLGALSFANLDFAVARFLTNGSPDTGFGTAGVATQDLGGHSEFVHAAALQADGSIVVVGRVFTDGGSGNSDFGAIRLLGNGTLDTTFGPGGGGILRVDFGEGVVVPLNFDGGDWDVPNDVLIQTDGKIVIAGYTGATLFRAAVLRLNSTGFVDPTFGTLGLTTSTLLDRANGVAVQADGRIVIGGGANQDFAIARFGTAGAIDDSFGTNGRVSVDFFGAADMANDILVQPDGKIVAAGSVRNGTNGLGIVRLAP